MILTKNIYYMLSYAFTLLNENGYKDIEAEEFENAGDLFAEILIRGVTYQIKKGVYKTYEEKCVDLALLKGKVDINASFKENTYAKKRMICVYDELSENNSFNQILKVTCIYLIKSNISKERKRNLKRLMGFFSNVREIDIKQINWKLTYVKSNQTYKLLINICYLYINGFLQSEKNGTVRINNYINEKEMAHLYEKFILEYYKRHYGDKVKVSASQIERKLDDDNFFMLPIMQSDIMLETKEKVLIIDAKYYDTSLQKYYETDKIRSNNLYQIFTYVKNKSLEGKETSGMLLYAKTDEEITPNECYMMSGNRISVKTLDLSSDFSIIKNDLNSIIYQIIN